MVCTGLVACLKQWEAHPHFTPKWVILVFGCYFLFFLLLGLIFLEACNDITEVSIALECVGNAEGDLPEDTGLSGPPTRECRTAETGNADAIEKIVFTPESDLEGPILMYYEVQGFFQSHLRYIKSIQNANANRQLRTGSCLPYQRANSGCRAEDYTLGPFGKIEHNDAIYRFWHPMALSSSKTGCYLSFSTRTRECLESNFESADCKEDPLADQSLNQHQTLYPCGLTSRLISRANGLDSLYVAGHESSEKPQEITFKPDYFFKYRNLDPEGTFDKEENRDNNGRSANSLHGKKFQEIVSMHLLKFFPPVVCKDDPLRLASPTRLYNDPAQTPDCTNYRGFSFDPSTNRATCNYMPEGIRDPVSGALISCENKESNPSGWGHENSHYINWNRISGMSNFRKLYAKITPEGGRWKAGERQTVYIAHRMNFDELAGSGHSVHKRVVFQNGKWIGAKNPFIAIIFFSASGLCGLVFLFVGVAHCKNPRRLEELVYLDWRDQR